MQSRSRSRRRPIASRIERAFNFILGHPGQAAQPRRSGIHSGAFPNKVPEWIPSLPSVARDELRLFGINDDAGFAVTSAAQPLSLNEK
ncbi:hypothetical protein BOSE62_40241 [Bosea sp. 62]|nr:hypothetical protein BOSE46_120547 [Bosea sp. 46]CAD5263198.1 hypothetical protein BOSE21B_110778 [Bosea sp. 21B]CAD5277168.1 hypothetical protein BOSE7B_40440 [Bosea sp. 7B]VVT58922.1 hypothetical protein BOS5A_200827 [Bosea sp. EC-HK365B]VXB63296.1 hypothetical protein BOSE29B_110711 [Bosea sp. 29B]VXC04115.1 hypothetical protein BOSE125_160503 [Bosea sp. 125]VXC37151.1 hypothetical protein BOSE62_40241 [Bosea sp. 62]VXC78869.1 hypothetical protein BOSE127_50146 [Bosea sp. 127]